MSTRSARTADASATLGSDGAAIAAAQASKAVPSRTATRGLTDITNRVAQVHQRGQPATRAGKEAAIAAADKKPHGTTTIKSTTTTTRFTTNVSQVSRTTSTRRTAGATTNIAAPTTSASAVPPVTRATVHQRATAGTARNTSATLAPTSSAALAATTTSAEPSRPRSVKRAANRAELTAAKKPRLGSDPDTSACALQEPNNAPVASPKDAGWIDLDQADWNDPVMVVEYADEIFAYMKKLEVKTMPSDSLLKQQREIAWSHRSTLVDWLISIHFKFRLLPETLFLAINILDRTLSTGPVSLGNFQLLGTTSMFIAAKYEEVMCPSIEYFGMCGGDTFNEEDLRACERQVLRKLEFDISYPNPMNFLRRISKADDYDVETRTLAKYLLEIGLLDWRLLAHPPSALAAAAFWLARRILHRGEWGATLVHYSTYAESELLATAEIMLDYILRQPSAGEPGHAAALNPNGQASGTSVPCERHPKFFKKYSAKRFFAVATYVRTWATTNYPHSVIVDRGEPEADEPIAVDLFGEHGYDRPNATHLMRIFNLNSTVIDLTDEDDGGLAPMPFSPQRAQTPPASLHHHRTTILEPSCSSTGGESMRTTPSTTNGTVRDDDAEMLTASFIEPKSESVGEVSDGL